MTQKLFLLIILISFNARSFGQNNISSRIFLRATTSVVSGEYFIDIVTDNDNTKVTFKFKDSIRNTELEKDTNAIGYNQILKTLKNFKPNNDTLITCLDKLDSINIAYTVYSIDSLIIPNSKNENYLNLIQKVLNSPSEILENKNHMVLDGTTMSFKLTNHGISRTVYARSPTLASNTFLYKLITETTDLYRKNKSNDFVNKRRTDGY